MAEAAEKIAEIIITLNCKHRIKKFRENFN